MSISIDRYKDNVYLLLDFYSCNSRVEDIERMLSRPIPLLEKIRVGILHNYLSRLQKELFLYILAIKDFFNI